ncbi:MAG: translation initiation factor IF-3 [Chloroflexi bacterium]|nr:translation initiation factor IF-3 [Chloroflexota bacterium]
MRISRRRFKPKTPRVVYIINEKITAPELRVVVDEGEHMGVVSTEVALARAKELELDLVVIQPKAEPPVAKIIDFGRYKYDKEKEAKLQKSKQKTVEVKGVRLSIRIGQHDIDVRKEQAKKHLDNGNKVKVEIILRGRERRHGARDLQKAPGQGPGLHRPGCQGGGQAHFGRSRRVGGGLPRWQLYRPLCLRRGNTGHDHRPGGDLRPRGRHHPGQRPG